MHNVYPLFIGRVSDFFSMVSTGYQWKAFDCK